MTFDVEGFMGVEHNCVLSVGEYANNKHVAISIFCEDGPFAGLTVNLPTTKRYPNNCGYVDINNLPSAEALIKKLGIGKRRIGQGTSGFCTYPLYEFNMDKVKQYTGDDVE